MTGIHAGPSTLYTGRHHAPFGSGDASNAAVPPAPPHLTPISPDQADLLRDGARVTPPAASEEEYIGEAREDGAASPKSRGWSRNLILGLFILLVIIGGALGAALGATLGKHSSSDAATKTSPSVPSSSTTSSTSSGSTLSRATTATTTSQIITTSTTTSTTTTTSPNSPPLITPGVTYTVSLPSRINPTVLYPYIFPDNELRDGDFN